MSKIFLSSYFKKSPSTISNWISNFENEGNIHRVTGYLSFTTILYIDEAKAKFDKHFHCLISHSSILSILHSSGLTSREKSHSSMSSGSY